MSLLYRLLSDRTDGRELPILSTFAEALAIWSDVEVRAYAAVPDGRFVRTATLPGSDPDRAPASLPAVLGGIERFRQLTAIERRELGFHIGDDVVLTTIGAHGGADWLLAASSQLPIDADAALKPYVEALEYALKNAAAIQSMRVTSGLMAAFIPTDEPMAAARAAAADVAAAVGVDVRFVVRDADDAVVLSTDDCEDSETASAASQRRERSIAVAVPAPLPCSAAIYASSSERPLTAGDIRQIELAASAFGMWLPGALKRLGHVEHHERDDPAFEDVIERAAEESLARHDIVSLVLIHIDGAPMRRDRARRSIERMRALLRPTDLTGRLETGEIGVLLSGTSSADADVVGTRLRELFNSTEQPATVAAASISPHSEIPSLLDAARRNLRHF